MSIKNKKLLYHLTSLENLGSILNRGLLPRVMIQEFDDVADSDIISFRDSKGLNDYVPFHFFCKNPFDGRVQKNYPNKKFIYICVSRDFAKSNNFKIIPAHPKSIQNLILFNYDEGFDQIEWDLMDRRNYSDDHCRHVCMAESLSSEIINPRNFYFIFTPNQEIADRVKIIYNETFGSVLSNIKINSSMFV